MTAIDYPSDLRGPLTNRVKSQFAKIRTTQPLSGPAYIQKLSTDAPVTYQFNFIFTSPNEAIKFRAWVEFNNINGGVPFNIKINTEASFGNGGNETQEVRFIPSGSDDLLGNTSNNIGIFNYSGTFLCRKEATGIEDFYEFISEAPLYALEGRDILDVSINISAPEV